MANKFNIFLKNNDFDIAQNYLFHKIFGIEN